MLKTRRDAERVRDECKEMVTKRALVAGGASALPVPAADAVADVAILLEMIPEINRRFELTPAQIAALPPSHQSLVHSTIKRAGVALAGRIVSKELILSALKTVGARVTAKQVIKFIPFVGSAVSAAIGFSAMKYVGDKHVDDCFGICLSLLNSSELRAGTVRLQASAEP